MADVLFVAVLIAFFAVAVAFVRACDRIIGPDTALTPVEPAKPEAERVAA